MSEDNHTVGAGEEIAAGATEENVREDMVKSDKPKVKRPIPGSREWIDMAVEESRSGRFKLSKPIRSNGRDVTELAFDFTQITGVEFADIMDKARNKAPDAYNISAPQALALFAEAAAKATKDIDKYDIIGGLSINDAIKATQVAELFFRSVSRQGDERITRS